MARRFPDLLERVSRGEVHLSTLLLLQKSLDETCYDELIAAVAGTTEREVLGVLAARASRPDVPSNITAIPTPLALPSVDAPSPAPARIEKQVASLSATRHHVQFTASDALREKLERAADLMRHGWVLPRAASRCVTSRPWRPPLHM